MCACLSGRGTQSTLAVNPPAHLKPIHQSSNCSTYTLFTPVSARLFSFPTVVTCYGLPSSSLNYSSCLIESCQTPCSPVLQVHSLLCCLPALFGSPSVRPLRSPCPPSRPPPHCTIFTLFKKSSCLEHSLITCPLSAFWVHSASPTQSHSEAERIKYNPRVFIIISWDQWNNSISLAHKFNNLIIIITLNHILI